MTPRPVSLLVLLPCIQMALTRLAHLHAYSPGITVRFPNLDINSGIVAVAVAIMR